MVNYGREAEGGLRRVLKEEVIRLLREDVAFREEVRRRF